MKRKVSKKRQRRYEKLHNALAIVKDAGLRRKLGRKLQKLINLPVK
jgi:hypothetical protein